MQHEYYSGSNGQDMIRTGKLFELMEELTKRVLSHELEKILNTVED